MEDSKRKKEVKQKEVPKGRIIAQGGDPERYYSDIEAESLISLRLTGNHRLYGYMTGRVFNVLQYDNNHGDNSTCVCRSYLKHT